MTCGKELEPIRLLPRFHPCYPGYLRLKNSATAGAGGISIHLSDYDYEQEPKTLGIQGAPHCH